MNNKLCAKNIGWYGTLSALATDSHLAGFVLNCGHITSVYNLFNRSKTRPAFKILPISLIIGIFLIIIAG